MKLKIKNLQVLTLFICCLFGCSAQFSQFPTKELQKPQKPDYGERVVSQAEAERLARDRVFPKFEVWLKGKTTCRDSYCFSSVDILRQVVKSNQLKFRPLYRGRINDYYGWILEVDASEAMAGTKNVFGVSSLFIKILFYNGEPLYYCWHERSNSYETATDSSQSSGYMLCTGG